MAIAWIPSLLLLTVGIGLSVTLVQQGRQCRATTDDFNALAAPIAGFHVALFAERRLFELYVADPVATANELAAARAKVDTTLRAAAQFMEYQGDIRPEMFGSIDRALRKFRVELPAMRGQINERRPGLADVSAFYSAMATEVETSMVFVARAQPVTGAGVEQAVTITLIRATTPRGRPTASRSPRSSVPASPRRSTRSSPPASVRHARGWRRSGRCCDRASRRTW